ncbi:nuclear transport factor 2 family protein [Allokutzneria sp. A3M-2-11 16]|uniref:nuclear transport factor 2 family protein n=1 Tax=Allokutzneria sp. A3M-2-11 16 TaxID=2962043 RepID=UPI0020B8E0E3|nr:nuclear transport factor 2 family protein [Allokutzneria sp. A3M-2-11 16]MCP3803143.1 nuclear transport factor 2 family protein [Allokutzneria sp. A3M-2-11 16]
MSQSLQTSPPVTADLYVEVMTFYARQMRLLDELDIDRFVMTFTEDGSVAHPHRSEEVRGRADMRVKMGRALPEYVDVVTRHWFDHYLVERDGDELRVTYYSLVTEADKEGAVRLKTSSAVEDVLVREDDGELRIRARIIRRDTPDTVRPKS